METSSTYFLHFIGKGLYSIEDFILESARYGVNRSLPANMLSRFSWGDKIFVAQFDSGSAKIFGYFTLSNINFQCDQQETFMTMLMDRIKTSELVPGPGRVVRHCGSYQMHTKLVVPDITKVPVKDLIAAAMNVAKELKTSLKVFAGGELDRIAEKTLSPIKFSRSGTYVTLDVPIEQGILTQAEVGFIGDYHLRRYFLKNDSMSQMDFFSWFDKTLHMHQVQPGTYLQP